MQGHTLLLGSFARLIRKGKQPSPFESEAILDGEEQELDGPSDFFVEKLWEQHRPVENDHHVFREKAEAHRMEELWQKEVAEGLALRDTAFRDPLLKLLLRPLSQWKLVPSQIFYELNREFKQLKNPSLQSLLMNLLFRSPVLTDYKRGFRHLELGFGDMIMSNIALQDQASAFINKGLSYSLGADKPLETGRFFFELSFFLCNYLKDAAGVEKRNRFNQLQELDQWMKQLKLSSQEMSILHLYRAAFHMLKPAHSDGDYADIFASWILYKLHPPLNSKWRSPIIESLTANAVNRLTCLLLKRLDNPQFRGLLGAGIFSQLNLQNKSEASPKSQDESWQIDEQLKLPYISKGEWKINLAMGQLFHTTGEIKGVDEKFPWEGTHDFKRLFSGETGFEYRGIGQQCVLFTHPKKGPFKLTPVSGSTHDSLKYYFESQLLPGSDRWLQYCPPDKLVCYPKPLTHDFSYWVPKEKTINIQGFSLKGFFCRLSNHQIAYVETADGLILEADSTGAPKANAHRLDYLDPGNKGNPDKLKGLLRFDSAENIVTYRDPHDRLARIVFKRYRSIDGNPLVFREQDGRYLFSENLEHEIPHSMPKSLLGTIENYLFLTPVTDPKPNSGLLILPFQRIAMKKESIIADGNLEIDVPPLEKKAKVIQKMRTERDAITASQLYFLYQVDAGRVEPKSLESKLFLAYLYLSQKKPDEAVRLLTSVKQIEMISATSLAILEKILDLKIHNDHPDFKMIRLHAFGLLVRQKQQGAKEPVKEFFDKKRMRKCSGWLN